MKSALFAKVLTLSAALAIAFTPGCRRKAKPTTPLSPSRTGSIQNPDQAGMRDGAADTTGGLTTTTRPGGADLGSGSNNIPLGGLGDISKYNSDRSQFAADTVYFDLDSAVIKTTQTGKLTAVADYLRSKPSAAVQVEGHCDERGTEEYNRSLGERRALGAREELAQQGIDPRRIFTISYGEERPAIDGHNESAWSKNRRAEFILLTPR